jgi:hypothetical protein
MRKRSLHVVLVLLAALAARPDARGDGQASRLGSLGTTKSAEIAFKPGMTLAELLARPDATVVVFPDGTRATVGEIRKGTQLRDQLISTLKGSNASDPARKKSKLEIPGARRVPEAVEQAAQRWARTMGIGTTTSANASSAFEVGVHGVTSGHGNRNVSPGDTLTITGYGFGDRMGRASLVGRFPGGIVPLRIVNWQTNEIRALLQPDLKDTPDHGVELQVVSADGRTVPSSKGGVFFIAAREDQTLDRNLTRLLKLSAAEPRTTLGDDGVVSRWQVGDYRLHCWAPSRDRFEWVDPGNGFVVSGFWFWTGRTDTGNTDATGKPGRRTFTGAYALDDTPHTRVGGGTFGMSFGVWESLTYADSNLIATPFDGNAARGCGSWYQLNVIVTGPAGLKPY